MGVTGVCGCRLFATVGDVGALVCCDGKLGTNWFVRGKAARAEDAGRGGGANWFVFGKPEDMGLVLADTTFGMNWPVFGNAGTEGELVTSVGTRARGAVCDGRPFGWSGGVPSDTVVGAIGEGATVEGGTGDGCGDGEGGTEVWGATGVRGRNVPVVIVDRGGMLPDKAGGGGAATRGGIEDVTGCGGVGLAEARTSGRRLSSSFNDCLS